MHHASDIYLHIINGEAGAAGELMARLALHLGCDAKLYPLEVGDIARVRLVTDKRGWLNEHYVAEMVRAAVFGEFEPWRPDQVERLKSMLSRH
jgi:hypothetical protein